MKRAIALCMVFMVLLAVVGCASEQPAEMPKEQPAQELEEQPAQEPQEQTVQEAEEQPEEQVTEQSEEQKESGEDWKKLYQDYLESLKDNEDYKSAENNVFRLYDMNKDDVPELIWDHADFSDHFSFLTCFRGSVREFDTAGRRAISYEVAWGVENTKYYIKEFDTGLHILHRQTYLSDCVF